MIVTVLGSGTSTGVPEYRCTCPICQDARQPGSRNRRTRPSLHVEVAGVALQIDVGPNFLDQLDACAIERIDAVLYTHTHADHISGTNDLVMPCRKQKMDMPVYGAVETLEVLQRNFDYMFARQDFQGGGIAHLLPHLVEGSFRVGPVTVLPLPVEHGTVPTQGYRIGPLAYLPDVKHMPAATLDLLEGVDTLIIDALSFNPRHPTHLSVGEAVAIAGQVRPRRTWLTHIMHRLDHRHFPRQCREEGVELPPEVALAWDGMQLRLPD
ncbi:MAG: MBL fold metallo-hydrolase [Candidatus Latescibacteria bacterium]|nr:MBL fold metallo-hydrolase [Candidatus Latescibacterota bacterium]